MASVSREVDEQHKSLLIKLCGMMDPNSPTYKNFILLLSTSIPIEMLSRVQQNPTDVFALMEEMGFLKAGKYQALEKALEASGYKHIWDRLMNEEECITRRMRKRSHSDGTMAECSSNIGPTEIPQYYGVQTSLFQQQQGLQTPQGLSQQHNQLLRYQTGQPLITDQQNENLSNSTTQFQEQFLQAPRPTVIPQYYGAQTTCRNYPANMFHQQQISQGLWQQHNQLLRYQTGQPLIPDQQNENLSNSTTQVQAQSLQAPRPTLFPQYYGAQTPWESYPANMFQQQQTPQELWQQHNQLPRYQTGQPLIPNQQNENTSNDTTQFQAQSLQAPNDPYPVWTPFFDDQNGQLVMNPRTISTHVHPVPPGPMLVSTGADQFAEN